MERKNLTAAISAFHNAFGGWSDSRIIVKVTNPGIFSPAIQRFLSVKSKLGGSPPAAI